MKQQRLNTFAVIAFFALAACEGPATTSAPTPEVSLARQALFNNGGFESGAFAPDWTVTTFRNTTGLAAAPFPPQTVANLQLAGGGWNITKVVTGVPTESQVFAGMANAPGVPKFPKFGVYSAVVNELSSSTYGFAQSTNSLKQNYVTTSADVDPADNTIHVRFVLAPALQAAGHAPQLQPYFFVVLRNQTAPRVGDLYTTFNFSNAPGTPWRVQGAGATAILYTDWTIFDIAPGNTKLQVGDRVEVEVFAAGCQPGGHFGEVYVDGFGATFPGISINKTAPAAVNVDSDITYTFTVKNNTTLAAPGIVADEQIPPNTTFVSLDAGTGICTAPDAGATGSVTCNFGWVNPGATNTFQVTVHAFPPAPNGSGTASAGAATTLTDLSKAWVTNAYRGYTVFITGGMGVGQQREVFSNTLNVLTVGAAWSTNPNATSTYIIANPPDVLGTATGGAGATLTDTTKSWSDMQWMGWTVSIVGGTGVGQSRTITANTSNSLTVSPNWATNPNATSVYVIKTVAKVNNGNYGVQGGTLSRLLGQRVETLITAGVPYTDLSLSKTDGVAGVAWGAPVTYTITVANNGPNNVSGATVTDTFASPLAANPTWVCVPSSGASCAADGGVGNINQTVSLNVGATATFTVSGAVIAGSGSGTLTNTASVAPPVGITDNFLSNNTDTDVDGVGTLFTLSVDKVAATTGQGTVISSPAAINCGPACTTASASFLSADLTIRPSSRTWTKSGTMKLSSRW